jgi:hypothetical protein
MLIYIIILIDLRKCLIDYLDNIYSIFLLGELCSDQRQQMHGLHGNVKFAQPLCLARA